MAEQLEGNPNAFVQLVSEPEARKVQAAIEVRYGFKPTLTYAADLAAFVLTVADTPTQEEAAHELGE